MVFEGWHKDGKYYWGINALELLSPEKREEWEKSNEKDKRTISIRYQKHSIGNRWGYDSVRVQPYLMENNHKKIQ